MSSLGICSLKSRQPTAQRMQTSHALLSLQNQHLIQGGKGVPALRNPEEMCFLPSAAAVLSPTFNSVLLI